jgi:hypothetical protein
VLFRSEYKQKRREKSLNYYYEKKKKATDETEANKTD